jgi:hypothetical protein
MRARTARHIEHHLVIAQIQSLRPDLRGRYAMLWQWHYQVKLSLGSLKSVPTLRCTSCGIWDARYLVPDIECS